MVGIRGLTTLLEKEEVVHEDEAAEVAAESDFLKNCLTFLRRKQDGGKKPRNTKNKQRQRYGRIRRIDPQCVPKRVARELRILDRNSVLNFSNRGREKQTKSSSKL